MTEESGFESIASVLSPTQLDLVGRSLKAGQPMAMAVSGLPRDRKDLVRIQLNEIKNSIEVRNIGLTLIAMSEAAKRAISNMEVVWSGAMPNDAMGRTTWGVLNEVVQEAHEYIYAATYSAGVNSPALVALRGALDRGIEVTCLLDIHHRQDSAEIVKGELKGARFLGLAKKDNGFPPMMHAKFIVVDGVRTFLTSANFSNIAVDKSLEVGLLIQNTFIASQFKKRIDDMLIDHLLVSLN